MRAPPLTYRFSVQKDTAGVTLEVLSQTFRHVGSDNPAVLQLDSIPKDKILILTNAVLLALPGATQIVHAVSLQGQTAAGALFDIEVNRPLRVADQDETINWDGEVWIPGAGLGNPTVFARFQYNAVVNDNQSDLAVHGLLIPRGNTGVF